MRHLRLALVLLGLSCALVPPCAAQAGEPQSAAGLRQRSAELASSYLRTWSTSAPAALDQVPRLYASPTRFHGRWLTHRGLLSEKAAFVQRWPVRRYVHRPGTLRVACNARSRRCLVRSVIDWSAANPARGASTHGSARFQQGIDLSGPRALVFLESGSVLARAGKLRRG